MSAENAAPLPIISPQGHQPLSALQEQFNLLLQQINAAKAELAAHTDAQQTVRQRVQKEIRPLIWQIIDLRVHLVHLFDHTYTQYLLPPHEQDKLAQLILSFVQPVLQHQDTPELEEIYQRYAAAPTPESEAPSPPDLLERESTENAPQELDWEDWETAQAQLEEQLERERQERQAQRSAKKKTKVQLTPADQLKLEILGTARATRRLYTDLAKLLHPDRELDATRRLWKEEAMKKVTVAYHQDDFFALLRLQMEYLQEQTQQLHQLPEQQLLPYVHLLQQQLAELQAEKNRLSSQGEQDFYGSFSGSPKQVELKFRGYKRELKEEIQQLRVELVRLQDLQALKALLKLI